MGQQYSPLANMNQFTGQMGIAGLNNMAAMNRQMAQLSAQQQMETNRLRETARATNLSHMLGLQNYGLAERRLGMDSENNRFGQQRDLATFEQNAARNNNEAAYRSGDLALKTLIANNSRTDAEAQRAKADENAKAKGEADWSLWDEEATTVGELLAQKLSRMEADFAGGAKNASKEEAARIAGLKSMIERIKYGTLPRYMGRVKWAREQYKQRGAGWLPSFFASNLGNIKSIRQIAELGDATGPKEQSGSALPDY